MIHDIDSDTDFNHQQSLTDSLNIDEPDLEGLIIINIIIILIHVLTHYVIYCKHEHLFEHSKFESKLNYLQLANFITNKSIENKCQEYICTQRSRCTYDQPY